MIVFTAFTGLLVLAYGLLILYFRRSWRALPEVIEASHADIFISVVVPARNETANMYALLTALNNQSYPPELFEIIIADDFSTDETAMIAKNFPAPNIRVISMQDEITEAGNNSFKKLAIEKAVISAKGSLIVCTDADCIMPRGWLDAIASFQAQKHNVFIAAPVKIDAGSSPIEIFQALDFMSLQGITAAGVHKRMLNMCNGANLAYEKNVFHVVEGFSGIDKIASGDDMLLMQKISRKYPDQVDYLKSRDAIVSTQPVKTLGEFMRQRIRWASKTGKYDDTNITAVLGLVYLLNVCLLLMPIFIALSGNVRADWVSWLVFVLMKTIVELYFLLPVAKFFRQANLLWYFPMAQPFHILYTVIAGGLGLKGGYTWKGRRVN